MTEAAAPALPAGLKLRQLGPDDAAATAALIHACDLTYLEDAPEGWAAPTEESERERWQQILSDPGRVCRGAFDNAGTLVAMAAVRQATEDDVPIEGVGHVSALFVHPARWRQGIARHLLAEAERLLRERGMHRAQLRTPEWVPARRFYEAQGWTATGEREFHQEWDMWTVAYEKPLGLP